MPPLRRVAAGLLLAAFGVVAGAANPPRHESPNDGPFRTVSEGADAKLMLLGHDAVAYFSEGRAVRGDPAIKVEHLGVTFRFASDANRAEFEKNPATYMPQFGGFCANGINYAVPWGAGGGPDSWRIYRGRLYVFGGRSSRDHFEMDTERNLDMAHRYWNDEVAGSNALVTRFRRLVFRVPHYRTDADLQREWQARHDAGTLPVMPGAPQVVPAQ